MTAARSNPERVWDWKELPTMTPLGRLCVAIVLKMCVQSCRPDDSDFWTDVICATRKPVDVCGLINDDSPAILEFFENLLLGVARRCETSVRLRAYSLEEDEPKPIDWSTMRRASPSRPSRRASIEDGWSPTARHISATDSSIAWTTNVLVLPDGDSLRRVLDDERSAGFGWNPRDYFILLLIPNANGGDVPVTSIVDILRSLWSRRQIHNVLLSVPSSGTAERLLYSFDPFERVGPHEWGGIERISAESRERVLEHLLDSIPRRTRDLRGYDLTVGLFGQWGQGDPPNVCEESRACYERTKDRRSDLDSLTLSNLAWRMNFSVSALEPADGAKFGYQLKNGTYVGTIGDVAYGRANASFVSYFVKNYGRDMTKVLEFSTYVQFDRLCVTVPKARRIPRWTRMYYVFQPLAWLCLLLVYVLVHFTWYFLQRHAPRRKRPIDWETSVYRTFLVYSGCPVKLPSSNAERVLLGAVFLPSITIVGLFSGVMYKNFARDMYYKEIDSLTELERSGLSITYGSLGLRDVFDEGDDDDDEDDNGDEDKDDDETTGETCQSHLERNLRARLRYAHGGLAEAARFRNTSALIRESHFPMASASHLDPDGTHRLHLVAECPTVYYLGYLLPRGSPLRERINELIGRLNQAGLPDLWNRLYVKTIISRKRRLIRRNSPNLWRDEATPFAMRDLQMSFYTLILGLLLATVVFLAEEGYVRRPKRFKILCREMQ